MTWSRRDFLRTGGLALLGGIFVPKYERWFRPLRICPPPGLLEWPAHNVHDVGILLIESRNSIITPPGFSLIGEEHGVQVFWKRVTSQYADEPPIKMPPGSLNAQIHTFRNVVHEGNPFEPIDPLPKSLPLSGAPYRMGHRVLLG